MKQIFNFEQKAPPLLNETMLLAEIEKRNTQRQTAVLAVASILLNACIFLVAFSASFSNPIIAMIFFAYGCISITGSGVITLVFTQKRRAYSR